ncbi:MAG: deoxyribonuclease IV [Candidatus Babeliales bacterium]
MRKIGLHLRIIDSLIETAQRAAHLGLKTFQCFLIHQITKKYLSLSDKEVKEFVALRPLFDTLYIHGAYWINISGIRCEHAKRLLLKEIDIAKRLQFTHYILHPGSAIGWNEHKKGIDCLVRVLNDILKNENDITIVLENTAHGSLSIGSDLHDFKIIREKLAFPEKVLFCLDTAHAYAFGYDIADINAQNDFMYLLNKTVGDAIGLIHLNDSQEKLGFKRDRHAVLGQGKIGTAALKNFILHEKLCNVPIIMEMPRTAYNIEINILNMVKEWHQ